MNTPDSRKLTEYLSKAPAHELVEFVAKVCLERPTVRQMLLEKLRAARQ